MSGGGAGRWGHLGDAALRAEWNKYRRILRVSGPNRARMAWDHPGRGEVGRKRAEARRAVEEIEAEMVSRKIRPRRRRDRGPDRDGGLG